MFDKINRWYNSNPQLWTEAMVREAVEKGVITPKEFKEITGKKY